VSDFWKLFDASTIAVSLDCTTKDEVINELLDLTVAAGKMDEGARAKVQKAIQAREKLGSTGIGAGVAIPHVKNNAVESTITAVGVTKSKLDYDAVDGEPCDLFLLLASPVAQAENHLQILRWLSTLVRDSDFLRFLRTSKSASDAAGLFKEFGE